MARDLVCLSHLRWDFVYQRPNHLMARAARDRRVYFVEEPLPADVPVPTLRSTECEGVRVVTPLVPAGSDPSGWDGMVAGLLDELAAADAIHDPVLWFYTPMALPWARQLPASAIVFDSMDDLSGFRGASPRLRDLEAELLGRADLVFTGGASLHRRMEGRHARAHCFPSSIDLAHFRRARRTGVDPADQAGVGRPRIGYAGVIDERIELELVAGLANARPDWQLVLLGPIAKIDEADLPVGPNIHRLGLKRYAELPEYLAGWDVGWMPFARNDATRCISPTKTPEYLAAGLPVVSTSIHDVVDPYARLGLVQIADTVDATIAAVEAILAGDVPDRTAVDAFLARGSWDRTWAEMAALVDGVVDGRARPRVARPKARRGTVVPLPLPVALERPLATPMTTRSRDRREDRVAAVGRAGD